jgi:hypothetical protein
MLKLMMQKRRKFLLLQLLQMMMMMMIMLLLKMFKEIQMNDHMSDSLFLFQYDQVKDLASLQLEGRQGPGRYLVPRLLHQS